MKGAIITIDSREPLHIQESQWEGAISTVATLECGDVEVNAPDGNLILIERKTPSDLLGSIKDRRLFNQVHKMVNKSKWCYVVIEGGFIPAIDNHVICQSYDKGHDETGWQWATLQGVLASIQELGCVIIYDPDFRGAVERIVNRSREDVKVAPRRGSIVFSPSEKILMSIDGIGNKKAQKILSIFDNNVALALTAMTAPHDGKKNHIDGWGKKSRDSLVSLLGGALEIKTNE